MIKFLEMREKLNRSTPALCIFGNDDWVKQRALQNVFQLFDVTDDGFGIEYLVEPTVGDIKMSCLTPNLLGGVKVVVCNNFVLESTKPQDSKKQAEAKKQLSEMLLQADGSYCLVFVASAEKPYADIANLQTINCNKLDKANVAKWIVSYARRQQVQVEASVADQIATYCLCDMARVSVETQKLIDFGSITEESVQALVHKDMEYVVYDLSNVIADKNATKALDMYKGLVAKGEEPRALFGLLYNYYRRVYYVKTSDFATDQVATYLGVKAGAIGFAKETAKRYKPMQLKRALDAFAVADKNIKSFVDENEVMTLLIMQLTML